MKTEIPKFYILKKKQTQKNKTSAGTVWEQSKNYTCTNSVEICFWYFNIFVENNLEIVVVIK